MSDIKCPLPPGAPEPSGKLEDEEVSYILMTTLRPEHREDPNVLRFISAFLKSRDARQAAREIGLHPNSGVALRNKPDIWGAIIKLTDRSVSKYGFDASEVVQKFKEVMDFDPIDTLNPDGTIKHLHELPAEARRCIKKFRAKNIYEDDPNGLPRLVGVMVEYEFYDKMKAGELLGREKDLFIEKKKIEHDVTSNMADILLESTRRADERQSQLESRNAQPIMIEARDVSDE
jgi:hypothetical protein